MASETPESKRGWPGRARRWAANERGHRFGRGGAGLISWSTISAVAVGGGLGAFTRFGIGECVRLCTPLAGWTAVLVSNLLGTILLAVLTAGAVSGGWFDASPQAWALAATGYCGALTTYSAFGLDTVLLWYEGRRALALGQMSSTLAIGLVAAAAIAHGWGAGA